MVHAPVAPDDPVFLMGERDRDDKKDYEEWWEEEWK